MVSMETGTGTEIMIRYEVAKLLFRNKVDTFYFYALQNRSFIKNAD